MEYQAILEKGNLREPNETVEDVIMESANLEHDQKEKTMNEEKKGRENIEISQRREEENVKTQNMHQKTAENNIQKVLIKKDNNNNNNKAQEKLCNRFVQERHCPFGEQCRYAHKKICKELIEYGSRKKSNCEAGHNTEGICRNFTVKGTCRFDKRCRFVHVELGKRKTKKSTIKQTDENREAKGKQNVKRKKTVTFDGDKKISNNRSAAAPSNMQPQEESHLGLRSGTSTIVQENDNSETILEIDTDGEKETGVERDLLDFLWLDLKHDVWKEVKGTKREIRELMEKLRC